MLRPARGRILVRPVETAEVAPGGRVILVADTRERMTAHQCEVIAVGAFAECDSRRSREERKCERSHSVENCMCEDMSLMGCSGECAGRRVHSHSIRSGDWLLVRPRCFVMGPRPERKEWFIHQDDVYAILGRNNDS